KFEKNSTNPRRRRKSRVQVEKPTLHYEYEVVEQFLEVHKVGADGNLIDFTIDVLHRSIQVKQPLTTKESDLDEINVNEGNNLSGS
ncbi:unnamed protein product, partial [Allacma fusca]